MSERLLEYALWGIAVPLAGCIAYLLGHGLWLLWHRKRTAVLLERGRAALARLLISPAPGPEELAALRALPEAMRVRLVMEPARSLSGSARDRLRELGEEIGVMNAARAQAAEWAGDHATPGVAYALLELLTDPATLCRFNVQDSLLRLGRVSVEPLGHYLDTHSGEANFPALRVAVEMAQPAFAAPAEALCRDAHPRVRARAAELLGAIGGRSGTAVLVSLLADPAAEVRQAAAHALGRMGHWPAAGETAKLLRDPEWEVRRAAAIALRAMGDPGMLLLRRFRDDADRFAADMARQVLQMPRGAEGIRV